jgi:hypothetical protein
LGGEEGVGLPVPLDVAGELGLPVGAVGGGCGGVVGAGVPEAAVDVDGDLDPGGSSAGQADGEVLAEPEPGGMESGAQGDLGPGVGLAVGLHDLRRRWAGGVRIPVRESVRDPRGGG